LLHVACTEIVLFSSLEPFRIDVNGVGRPAEVCDAKLFIVAHIRNSCLGRGAVEGVSIQMPESVKRIIVRNESHRVCNAVDKWQGRMPAI